MNLFYMGYKKFNRKFFPKIQKKLELFIKNYKIIKTKILNKSVYFIDTGLKVALVE